MFVCLLVHIMEKQKQIPGSAKECIILLRYKETKNRLHCCVLKLKELTITQAV